MRSLPFVVASFMLTVCCWGMYGPVLHEGQKLMSTAEGQYARMRPFICVGLAYFVIGVVVPLLWLRMRGEQGHWTFGGAVWSLAAGAFGALGALGIVLAFTFGGQPVYVMPLVFGGAPVVNAFLTIYMVGKMKEIGPVFLAGMIMVILGAVTVLIFAPTARAATFEGALTDWLIRLAAIAMVIVCWGAYGPVLHRGQAAMQSSRMRPLICVGLSYFLIAVLVTGLALSVWGEQSEFNFFGSLWSLAAGAAGAFGALGVIMAFNFGGKPVYVMPLVFGGAPVVNTLVTATARGLLGELHPMFLAGLILVIAGSAMVLVFAPRGTPRIKRKLPAEEGQGEEKKTEEAAQVKS